MIYMHYDILIFHEIVLDLWLGKLRHLKKLTLVMSLVFMLHASQKINSNMVINLTKIHTNRLT